MGLSWYLLTSIPVSTADEALTVLGYYVRRWRVAEFFRVLKSGCQVERLSLRTAQRLGRAIALYCVISWRLMVLTLLGRAVPALPAEVFFTEVALRFLTRYAKKYGRPPPTTLEAAVREVALLGGYLNRSRDGPPGHQTLWKGLERLTTATFVMDMLEHEDD